MRKSSVCQCLFIKLSNNTKQGRPNFPDCTKNPPCANAQGGFFVFYKLFYFAGPELSLSTSSTQTSSLTTDSMCRSVWLILLTKSSTASPPNSARGIRTVVSAGSIIWQIGRSSKPTIEISSGTRIPARSIALTAP